MSTVKRKVEAKKKTPQILSDSYIDEICDNAVVVGVKDKEGSPQHISLLFSRRAVTPILGIPNTEPFELTKRYVASITMEESDAKRLALNILKGLGVKSLDPEDQEIVSDDE
ncbi:hypothetical protein [Pseudomonas sp. DR208]|uniref:hypothetical protein n=1 Tax=Pseudomonas sp. DR208 TaxID=2870840 RepID=UPI001C9918D1|nr:hypothetical protein [Pseudomonas sp. DR208]QZP18719.1 hypothetical protein K5K89_15345 [Pseudomonas sp. DR208]